MYEYKVEVYKFGAVQEKMNELAKEGWRVIAVCPSVGVGNCFAVTFERETI